MWLIRLQMLINRDKAMLYADIRIFQPDIFHICLTPYRNEQFGSAEGFGFFPFLHVNLHTFLIFAVCFSQHL
ncbi:hypothetical protein D3C73_1378000 [compost metagenome]